MCFHRAVAAVRRGVGFCNALVLLFILYIQRFEARVLAWLSFPMLLLSFTIGLNADGRSVHFIEKHADAYNGGGA